MKKRGKLNNGIDTIKLLKQTEGYSGADIEAVIKDSVEKAFLSGKSQLTTEDILETIKDTKPLSLSLGEKIKKLRESLTKINVKNASDSAKNS